MGGSPTTAYAQNIAVMAATRVCSTAACYVSAAVASVFGLSPKFGAVAAATPGGVLGAITVILYAMIAILGAKIWKENDVDFTNPINRVPVLLHRHRHRTHEPWFSARPSASAASPTATIVAVGGYHMAHAMAPRHMKDSADGAVLLVGGKDTEREELNVH